jgi:hypothetical protein
VAAIWQPDGVDHVGRGLEHQLPQWYSQVGGMVVVQRAAEVVAVVDVIEVVVIGTEDVVHVVEDVVLDGVVEGEDEDVAEVVEDVVLDEVVEGEDDDVVVVFENVEDVVLDEVVEGEYGVVVLDDGDEGGLVQG